MNGIGLDCGNATLKLVLLSPEGKFLWEKTAFHYGAVVQSARRLLGALLAADPGACGCPVVITGNAGDRLKEGCDALAVLGEIPAIHLGVRLLAPEARSAIEIGSQSARFLTGLDQNTPPRFAVNEHCAGGTGSFFEDQMSRLGLKLEDYSRLVGQARSIPRLSGRCAVFAKTDIIHRQQEGVPTPDILLGLCYALVRNYKAVIVRGLPVEKPVALCGGIGHNQGVIQAVREVFGLTEAELILPEKFPYAGAAGAAEAAMETATCSMGELLASLCGGALEGGDRLCRQPALRVLPGTPPSVPAATGTIPPDGCVLGIDVGSTSTDLVLTGRDGTLIDYQYLRTAGDPEGAVRRGLDVIHERFGPVSFLAVGVTGSGRERIGRLIGADAVRDEITAQARAAVHWSPDVDTVFEIGGQDSKYISLRGGQVADFQMNRICAAGTGSFVEEQAGPQRAQRGGAGRAVYGVYRDSHPVRTLPGRLPGRGGGWPVPVHCPQLPPQGRWGQACRKPRGASGRCCLQSRDRGRLSAGIGGAAHSFTLFPHQRRLWSGPAGAGVSPRPVLLPRI